MKKFLGIKLTLVLFFCLTSVINAQTTDVLGWQEAKWNMSEQELLDTFKPKITKLDKRKILSDDYGYEDYAILDYEIEGNKFTVYFDMDNTTKKLKRVQLRLNEGESLISKDSLYFPLYESLLTRKYGTPSFKNDDRKPRMVVLKRQWIFKTTTIELRYVWSSMGNFSWLTIMYFPSQAGDINKV